MLPYTIYVTPVKQCRLNTGPSTIMLIQTRSIQSLSDENWFTPSTFKMQPNTPTKIHMKYINLMLFNNSLRLDATLTSDLYTNLHICKSEINPPVTQLVSSVPSEHWGTPSQWPSIGIQLSSTQVHSLGPHTDNNTAKKQFFKECSGKVRLDKLRFITD